MVFIVQTEFKTCPDINVMPLIKMHSRIQSQCILDSDSRSWRMGMWLSTQLRFSFQLDFRLRMRALINAFRCEKLRTNYFNGKQYFSHTNLIQPWKIFSNKDLFHQSLQNTVLLLYKSILGFIWKLRIGHLGWWTKQKTERWERTLS